MWDTPGFRSGDYRDVAHCEELIVTDEIDGSAVDLPAHDDTRLSLRAEQLFADNYDGGEP
jgi:hypothetical protein